MNILASVSDKRDLVPFLNGIGANVERIYATGSTFKHLQSNGIKAISTSTLTGFDSLLDGRVKTLHPAIFAGILARDDPDSLGEIDRMKFPRFDLVICNLYPFHEKSASGKLDDMIENIDIGGVSLIRAAAKNFERVTVASDPEDYHSLSEELMQAGQISLESRRRLAVKAFRRMAVYDIEIYQKLNSALYGTTPKTLFVTGYNGVELRYGENPQQKGFLFRDNTGNGIANATQIQGKELSYNNLMDSDSAYETVLEFDEPTAVVIKHNTPCGVASSDSLGTAIRKAIDADSESAYGSVIAVNGEFDSSCYTEISKMFVEVLIAPSYSQEALELLKKKKNLRVLRVNYSPDESLRVRSISNGILAQERLKSSHGPLQLKSGEPISDERIKDLEFSWKVVAHCRSNAIVIAKDRQTVGIGAGQTSRVEAMKIAVDRSGEKARGSVLASDAFFPFYDNVEVAGRAGISAIIQPGGSIRDDEVIARASELGISMYFTSTRVFLH